MNISTTATAPHADIAVPAGPSALGIWLRSALKRALTPAHKAPAVRDLAFEAAKVRAFAMTVRDTDPGFAADLFAAADRHELTQA